MKQILVKEEEKMPPRVFIIKHFTDVDEVIAILKKHRAAIVNASLLPKRDGYRAIDFLSGFCYGLNGHFQRMDELIYRFVIPF